MDLDRYVPRDSGLHRADPRLKLLLALSAILGIALLPAGVFVAYGIVWLTLVAAATLAHLGPLRLVRGSWVVLPFVLVAVPLLFTRPGEPLLTFEFGSLGATITDEGVIALLTIATKSWLSVQVALLLTYTTHFGALVDGLRSLRVPAIIVDIVSFLYRYLAVLLDEAGRMNRARSARSASIDGRPGGGVAWRARVTGALVGSLFIRAYERSERVYAAMLSRGFAGAVLGTELARPSDRELLRFAVAVAAIATFTLAVNAWTWS